MKNTFFRICTCVPLMLAGFGAADAADYFVAPSGNDTNAGSPGKPFATLNHAQQAARLAARKEPVTVNLQGGIYYLTETLVLDARDSGSEQAPVTYQAMPGEEAVISGGVRLDLHWQPFTNGIWKAVFAESETGTRQSAAAVDQLFVNGRRQPMARYPNYDPDQPVYNGFAADAFSPERAARWSDPAGGYIHALHRSLWGGYHYRITGKGPDNTVTYEGGWQNNRQMGMHREYRYVENIFEELDAPGEWYHDLKSRTLYFRPPTGLDLARATIEVVRLRHLIEFSGSGESPVRFVSFKGITFRQAARTFMETKEPLLRSDWTIYRGGAVVFGGTEDCALAGCTFDQVGGNAIFVNNYNRRVAIRGCLIQDSGASGVAFVGDPKAVRNPLFEYHQRQNYEAIDKTPGPLTDNYPADCLVEDCLIARVGRVEKQTAGVEISMAQNIIVRHCSIYETPRAGINIGDGCWGGHVIEFCDVFDTVRETGDHGSFNSWGRDRYWQLGNVPEGGLPRLARLDAVKPVVIRNSRWRCDHGWDVDLDDGSSNYQIYNNLLLHGGLKLREGFDRVASNNIIVNNSFHPHAWYPDSGDEVTRNIFMGALRPAAMKATLKKWGRQVDQNFYTTGEADRLKFADKGCDTHSLVGDPCFQDPAAGDFRVKDGSPVLKLGFKNFPMDQFGVRNPRLKAIARTPVIPSVEIRPLAVDLSGTAVTWRGATLRNLVGEEHSAVGVARDAGGVLVSDVPSRSEAAKTGFRNNDFLQSINGQPVQNASDFLKILRAVPPGQKVKLEIFRDQKSEMIEIESARAD